MYRIDITVTGMEVVNQSRNSLLVRVKRRRADEATPSSVGDDDVLMVRQKRHCTSESGGLEAELKEMYREMAGIGMHTSEAEPRGDQGDPEKGPDDMRDDDDNDSHNDTQGTQRKRRRKYRRRILRKVRAVYRTTKKKSKEGLSQLNETHVYRLYTFERLLGIL